MDKDKLLIDRLVRQDIKIGIMINRITNHEIDRDAVLIEIDKRDKLIQNVLDRMKRTPPPSEDKP